MPRGGHHGGGGRGGGGRGHHFSPHVGWGGGPHHHGPGGWWGGPRWLFWGPPPIHGEPPPPCCWLPCWLCCWAAPPPPPPRYVPMPPVYAETESVVSEQTPLLPPMVVATSTAVHPYHDKTPLSSSVASAPREVVCQEFRHGDTPEKFLIKVPEDAIMGHILRVRLDGTEYTVKLPDYIHRGENVIVIAPAKVPTTLPSGQVITTSGPSPSSPSPRPWDGEVRALELRHDDVEARYPFVVPDFHGDRDRLGVRLAGREFTIRLPDNVKVGDQIIVVAPAAII